MKYSLTNKLSNMKKVFIIAKLLFLATVVFGQNIPNYVFPEDNYNFPDEVLASVQALSDDMAKGMDPSFEKVAAIFPHYMDYPKTLVGIKEHHGRFLSSWDGAIIAPPQYISFEVWENHAWENMEVAPIPFSSPDVVRLGESLVGDWLPVVNRKFAYKGYHYDQTIMAVARDFDTDSPLLAWVRMKVTNNSKSNKSQHLSIRFRGTGSRPSTQIWATSGRVIVNHPMSIKQDGFRILNENDDVIYWSNRENGIFGDDRLTYRFNLKAGEESTLYFCIPFEPINRRETALIEDGQFDQMYAQVSDYWHGMMQNTMQIDVPEEMVNHAYRTWQVNNFLLVQQDKLRLTYKTTDAPFFYEGIFGYAAAMYLNTITTAGYYDEAKRCAGMFLDLQLPDGSITGVNRSNSVIPHQHGAILYTISQIYRMGRDKEWFASVAPQLIKGCEWIIYQRSLNKNDRNAPDYGLLPAMRSNVDNGNGTQEYCGNAWCWAGMNEVGLALTELGGSFAAEGKRLLKEADDYRKCILTSMDKLTVIKDNVTYIPLDLADRKPYEYALTNTKSFYYTMIGSRMLESLIFDKDDPRMEAYTNYFEHFKGIALGLCRHSRSRGFTAHFSGGYGISNLRMGKLDRSLMNFYGMFAYGQARNLYATQEHDNFISGKNDSWYYARQPHLHSTSELLRITNKMLIYQERNDICLAFGVPKAWLEDGKKIEVKNSQTCFGPVSYCIESNVAGDQIHATVNHASNSSKTPSIKLKLRHPEGKAIVKVEINGQKCTSFSDEIITLPARKANYDINIFYK